MGIPLPTIELEIRDDDGKPTASLFYTAYTRDGGGNRPVTFLFNGGPGSPTIWLHMGSIGPVRVVTEFAWHNLFARNMFINIENLDEYKKHIPEFTITYEPDFRQKIADSWPASIDDAEARKDWGWKHKFDLESMTVDMLEHFSWHSH